MEISLKVTICFMTASVSLLSVAGNNRGPANINCDNAPVNHAAHVGGSVTINCSYSRAKESNIRYFCSDESDDDNFSCKEIISAESSNYTRLQRYSLTDNKQQKVYTVTISELTQADARRYQCAMKNSISNTIECLTKIHLHFLDLDDINTTKILHRTHEDSVFIKCNYPASDENKEKFLCKGDNPFICEELINTTGQGRDMTKNRFTIHDSRRHKYFYVYIKNPSIDDSGTYWCSSDRTWQHAPYAKIHLTVDEKTPKKKKTGLPALQGTAVSVQKDESPTTSSHPANASEKGVIVGVVVSLALLLIAVFTLILLCRHKLIMTQGGSSDQRTTDAGNDTEGHDGDHYYEEIQANLGNTLPSIYVTVSHSADQLH